MTSTIGSMIIRVNARISTNDDGLTALTGIIPNGYAPVALTYSWQTVFASFGWNYSNSTWFVKLLGWGTSGVKLTNVDVTIWCIKQQLVSLAEYGMTSIIQSKDMVVSTVSKSGYTVGANGFVEITIDVTKSGYKPIGVVGIDKWGGGSVSIVISTYYINGNNFKAYLRNVGNASAEANLTVHILYQKA